VGGRHDPVAAHLQNAPQDVLKVCSGGSGKRSLPVGKCFPWNEHACACVQQLKQYQNYHSLMAIISGLNVSAISRLKTVKEDKAAKVGAFPYLSEPTD